jgi:high-affinity nickel-transport protein
MNTMVKAPEIKGTLRERLTRDEWRRMGAMFGFIAFLHVLGLG